MKIEVQLLRNNYVLPIVKREILGVHLLLIGVCNNLGIVEHVLRGKSTKHLECQLIQKIPHTAQLQYLKQVMLVFSQKKYVVGRLKLFMGIGLIGFVVQLLNKKIYNAIGFLFKDHQLFASNNLFD